MASLDSRSHGNDEKLVINFDQRLYDKDMHFVPMSAGRGAHILALEFRQQLELHEHVLWLVSGGSNIPMAVQVMDELPLEFTSKMTVMPIDDPISLREASRQARRSVLRCFSRIQSKMNTGECRSWELSMQSKLGRNTEWS